MAESGVGADYVRRKQQYYQSIHKLTHMKGPYDKITSVIIPSVMCGTAVVLIARGLWNMSHGIGKKE